MIGRFGRSASEREQILMFAVMLVNALGTTGMMSVLPAIGRLLAVPDLVIAVAFSLSALLWAVVAPLWARQLGRMGARKLILIGLSGYATSLLIGAAALTAALLGWVSAAVAFIFFILGRTIYGAFGAAAPPATQAIVAAATSKSERTRALSLLASSFGLGTILGPALAPFLVLPLLGLAGPPFVFALFGVVMMLIVLHYLPSNVQIASSTRLAVQSVELNFDPHEDSGSGKVSSDRLKFVDARIFPWMLVGIVSGHAHSFISQTMAFLIMDRLSLMPSVAQPIIGTVLMSGAGAMLLGQWGLVARLHPTPRQMVVWGTLLAVLGSMGIALAHQLSSLIFAYCIASVGFGLLRPSFAAGASLAVHQHEQGVAAGYVTSAGGIAFVLGPLAGIVMYQFSEALPAYAAAISLAALMPMVLTRLRDHIEY